MRPRTDHRGRKAVLDRWYRSRLKEQVDELIAKWEPMIGVAASEWGIRKMKTHWGTCNTEKRRVWLNPELAKKLAACTEYVLVHELVHLLERHHNDRFVARMDKFLPQWRLLRDELNRSPLVHEDWDY